jgi:PRTRC genetic system ThiF family protein
MVSEEVDVHLVGCGGNGSQMLTGLARLNHAIRCLGHPGLNVTTFDPDTVSDSNIGRQLFSGADVGLSKAVVLTHRVNAFFGLNWSAQPYRYLETDFRNPTITILCVDTAAARYNIQKNIRHSSTAPIYVLDMGNRASDGQVILGEFEPGLYGKVKFPDGHAFLPSPYDVLPELIDVTVPEDDTPSCGLAEALERQELFINQAVVTPALQLLWELFRHGRLTWHGAFINLRTGRMQPIQVKEPS